MKVNSFAKLGVILGATAISVATLVAPAHADNLSSGSYGQLVGFGSDTTQDVMSAIASAINTAEGSNILASYDATGSSPYNVKTRAGQLDADNTPRAAGSGEGYNLLKMASGYTSSGTAKDISGTTQTLTKANTVGKVDFARASSKRTPQNDNGVFVNVPFAKDATWIAYKPGSLMSKIPAYAQGASGDAAASATLTTPISLWNVYHCVTTKVALDSSGNYAGFGGNDLATPAGGSVESIIPLLPKTGSGTRDYWVGLFPKTGDSSANWNTNNTCVKSGWDNVDSVATTGTSIEEHDGTAINAIANSIGVYSIPQWVSQSRSTATDCATNATDRRHNVVIGSLTASGVEYQPTTGSTDCTRATNADFPLTRLVYNVVPSRLADDENSLIHRVFVGTSSLVCQQTDAITKMGFINLTATTGAGSCGSTDVSNRLGDPASSVVNATGTAFGSLSSTSTHVGSTVTATVTVGTSNHNMGGTVKVYDVTDGGNELVGTGSIAADGTSTTVSIVPTAVGARTLHAYFVPALPGIKTFDFVDTIALTVADATTTSISVKSTTTIGGTVRVVAWVSSQTQPEGVIQLKDGGVAIADATAHATVAAGETAEVLTFKASKKSYALTATFTPTDSGIPASTSSSKSVTAPALAATLKLTKGAVFATPSSAAYLANIKRTLTTSPKLTVTITGPAGKAKASGTVEIYAATASGQGTGTLIGTGTLNAGGVVTVTLNAVNTWGDAVAAAGDAYLNVKYVGDTRYDVTYLSKKIKVTN